MILKELINSCNESMVVNTLIELYPDQIELKSEYLELISKLKNMIPTINTDNPLTVFVHHVKDFLDPKETYESVSGYSYSEKISYGCEFSPFEEWLGMDVAEPSLNHYGINKFIAHILWEMTFVSFDNEVIAEESNNLKAMSEMIDTINEKEKNNEPLTEEESKMFVKADIRELFEDLDEDENDLLPKLSDEEINLICEENKKNECQMLGIEYKPN